MYLHQDEKQALSIQSSILERWNDSRLSWNPEDYGGIRTIYVSSEYVWTPKLFINDSHYNYGIGSCEPSKCLIRSDAEVSCLFPCEHRARCSSDWTDWPFDFQTCKVVFKSFQTQEDVSFDADQMTGAMIEDADNRWRIIESKARINVSEQSSVKMSFVILRIDGSIVAHVLIPGYILITLTLSILWMKHDNVMRSILCGVSIYLHFNLIDRVWWQ